MLQGKTKDRAGSQAMVTSSEDRAELCSNEWHPKPDMVQMTGNLPIRKQNMRDERCFTIY